MVGEKEEAGSIQMASGGVGSKQARVVPGQKSLPDSFCGGPAHGRGVRPPAETQAWQVEMMALSDSEEGGDQGAGRGWALFRMRCCSGA